MTYSLSSDLWTSDARCHPLTLAFQYSSDSGSSWTDINPASPVGWVSNLSQSATNAPFSYTVDMMLTSIANEETYLVRNTSENKDQAKFVQTGSHWTIHFYDVSIA